MKKSGEKLLYQIILDHYELHVQQHGDSLQIKLFTPSRAFFGFFTNKGFEGKSKQTFGSVQNLFSVLQDLNKYDVDLDSGKIIIKTTAIIDNQEKKVYGKLCLDPQPDEVKEKALMSRMFEVESRIYQEKEYRQQYEKQLKLKDQQITQLRTRLNILEKKIGQFESQQFFSVRILRCLQKQKAVSKKVIQNPSELLKKKSYKQKQKKQEKKLGQPRKILHITPQPWSQVQKISKIHEEEFIQLQKYDMADYFQFDFNRITYTHAGLKQKDYIWEEVKEIELFKIIVIKSQRRKIKVGLLETNDQSQQNNNQNVIFTIPDKKRKLTFYSFQSSPDEQVLVFLNRDEGIIQCKSHKKNYPVLRNYLKTFSVFISFTDKGDTVQIDRLNS